MSEVKLTAKQEAFCEEYMVDLNATQACIRAGYSEDTSRQMGSENLSKPYMADRIAELMAERTTETGLSAQWVLEKLQKVHDRCMQEEAVESYDKDAGGMQPTGEFKFEHSGANKSLELIGKHLGMFTDNVKNTHTFDLSGLSDEELNALAAGQPVGSNL